MLRFSLALALIGSLGWNLNTVEASEFEFVEGELSETSNINISENYIVHEDGGIEF